MLHRPGCPGGRKLTIRMECALAADRIDDDGRIPGRAEQVDGHVDLAEVDEAANPQAVVRKARGVGVERRVAVDARREIAEMRGRQD